MGWSSGSQLADEVWRLVRPHLLVGSRMPLAKGIIKIFESYDCDTMEECERLQKDAAPKRRPREED